MARLNLVQAIDQALLQEMEADDQVVVLGEDVGRDGGVFRVTEGLVERFGEERVIDTPLAESGIVGVSIGMALAGYRPVAEISEPTRLRRISYAVFCLKKKKKT